MPEYLSPGVYVEEVDAGAKPIEGVSTSTAGFVGVSERGRFGNPELVTSFAQYLRLFGHHLPQREYPDSWYLSHAIQGFFTNGGKRAYVVRVLPDTAEAARLVLYDRGDTAGPAEAVLAARTRAGDGYLVVDDAAGIPDGSWLLLAAGAESEYVRQGGAAAAVLAVHAPLESTLRDGDEVGFYLIADSGTDTELDGDFAAGVLALSLDDATGIGPDSLLRITDGARTEYVRMDGAAAGDDLTLVAPTVFAHGDATPVSLVDDPPVLEGALTLAVGEAGPGTHLVSVADGSSAAAADAIGFGVAPTTFHSLGETLVVRLATALARHADAGSEATAATLNDDTAFTLTTDAAAGGNSIEVDDAGTFAPDAVVLLDGGEAEAEYVVVESVDGGAGDPGTVTLRSPLRFPHAAASPGTFTTVSDDTPDPPATAGVGIVTRRALAGDDVVVLSTGGGIAAGDVLRFGDAAAGTAEYREIAADDLDLLALSTPVAGPHLAGAALLGRSAVLRVAAIDAGAWGNCLRVVAQDDDPLLETTVAGAGTAGDPTLDLTSAVGVEPGSLLEFYTRAAGVETVLFHQKVEGRIGNIVSFTAAGLLDNAPAGTRVRTREFRLTVECVRTNPRTQREEIDADMSETFRHLSLDPRHSRYAVTVIGAIPAVPTADRQGESRLVKVEDLGAGTAEATLRFGPDALEQVVNGQLRPLGRWLAGGDDHIGDLTPGDYVGADSVDPDDRTGLQALKNIEDVSIVAVPGRTSQVEQNALVEHCVEMRYRVAVLDSRPGDGTAEVQEHRNLYDSRYAALYYPWLQIPDPFPRNPRAAAPVDLPPSGHVVGIYARSDNTRGVHKAPANEVVRGITGVAVKLTKGEHDILNPRNINVIRDFREQGRGIRVWGARIATSDADWRYLNVRRLFNFVEHSLDRGTQWVVFEPNDHRLWARLGQSVSSFLNLVWKDGALMGRTAEEAFFVKVDETTMTQDDIDAGRLVMLIGIAPVKPAEFVIIRIGQWAGGSSVQEL